MWIHIHRRRLAAIWQRARIAWLRRLGSPIPLNSRHECHCQRFQDAGSASSCGSHLLLGEKAHVFQTLERYAPIHDDGLGQQFTSRPTTQGGPRLHRRRCARMAKDWHRRTEDRFLEQAGAYQGQPLENPEPGDVTDVGEAMDLCSNGSRPC